MAKKQIVHVATRRVLPTPWQAKKIDRLMDAANRMYNKGVSYVTPKVEALVADEKFQADLKLYLDFLKEHPQTDTDNEETKVKNPYQKAVSAHIKNAGLTEYGLHAWFKELRDKEFQGCLNIDIIQKQASALYSAIRKVVFSNGKEIHYRKRGQTNTLESKRADNAIVYHPKTDDVKICGMKMPLKPIREKDTYLQEAMQGKIKYCKIHREPFKNGYRYFLQILIEGPAPKKFEAKEGVTAQDPGLSISAFYGDNYNSFDRLAPDVDKYLLMVRKAAIKYERRRRMANPENYNPDGTIKRDTKTFKKKWRWTKGIYRALFELKNAYRLKTKHVSNSNGHLSNQVVRNTSILKQEQMNYRGMARRAKKTERQDKVSVVTNKRGEKKSIRKYKRKKRHGKSVCSHAPSAFDKMLRDKVVRYGGKVIRLDPAKTKSSQLDHSTGQYVKVDLSQRTKTIDGQLVQRDGYSAFLNYHTDAAGVVSIEACKKDFPRFLAKNKELVDKMLIDGDPTGNFGLADFKKAQNL